MNPKNKWNKKEDLILIENYGKVSPEKWKKLIPTRTYSAIRTRATKVLKLNSSQRQPYSKKEINFLKEHYPKSDNKYITKIIQKTNPHKTWPNIRAFCTKNNIKREKYFITDREINYIKTLYTEQGFTYKQIALIVNRGECNVNKIVKGLNRKKNCYDCGEDISEKNNVSSKYCQECRRKRRRLSLNKYNKKDIAKKTRKKYSISEKGKVSQKLKDNRRRATKNNQIFTIGYTDLIKIYQRDKKSCVYCKASNLREGDLHIDHIIPVSKGGDWSFNNLVVSCKSCNSQKSNLNVETFCKRKKIVIPKIIQKLLIKQKEQKRLV